MEKGDDRRAGSAGKGPAVTRMVLFKHGVAYLERGGPAEGPFELSFRRDEMNDVLKSLSVWVSAGDARVSAVTFEADDDPEQALASRNLLLGNGEALNGLLAAVKGRRVRVASGDTIAEGEVVGLDLFPIGDGAYRRQLVLRTADGVLGLVDLQTARSLELVEDPSRSALGYLVDRSRAMTAGTNRIVKVLMSGRADDLRVSYIVPAPTWRVSYRVLVRGAERETPGGVELVLMAWGIVHNPADEDVEDVDLTLTTGQPVSFVIDLYQPKRLERAVVEEERRVAAAPRRIHAAFGAPPPPAPGMMPMASPAMMPMAMAAPEPEMADIGGLAPAFEGAATGAERGELFEYRVASKVSLKRGGSAMVPLASATITGKKERIWRDGQGPSPDIVLSFRNTSNLVLEEGPSVIYDDNVYAGEAMVPYAARDAEVRFAFAKDLAIRCKQTTRLVRVLESVRLGRDGLFEQIRTDYEHLLEAESDADRPMRVSFELPKVAGRKLRGDQKPVEETLDAYRFAVDIEPHARARAEVHEATWHATQVAYGSLDRSHLAGLARDQLVDEATRVGLDEVLRHWEQARRHERRAKDVRRGRDGHVEKQKNIKTQLEVLKEGGAEGALRLRYVKELEQAQDAIALCDAELARLEAATQEENDAAEGLLRQLVKERGAS